MISLDTNVLLAAFDPEDACHLQALQLLDQVGSEALAICPVVYSELAASRSWEGLRAFLEKAQVDVLWDMPPVVWERAGRASGEYARTRRGGVLPRRIVADFLVGAHAEHHGLAVATLDPVVFRTVFTGVRLLSP
ncbi:MAG: type II toxin-antitoxin system VapC family toxin [Armatimonadota bacterium]|nr:type II toxin-antitoxin system VapC family toxin [Armatimonadota bacterium]MDR7388449.1 type II toxin-antitoxin system VapC family toxin [Armatimonadota bacterium]MDR7392735.1 type II toxin-antitoxin system VapC family toxin [Armatimonadota bacterium]MDR7396207.1 type II toxin-antitoxin system VapC family toxin [Armatimonadota bacterium]MDR7399579.1 type II toxin-antitoxin system VapC family toxin [Armatimonadota bacterium]